MNLSWNHRFGLILLFGLLTLTLYGCSLLDRPQPSNQNQKQEQKQATSVVLPSGATTNQTPLPEGQSTALPLTQSTDQTANRIPNQIPNITAAPIESGNGQWLMAKSDTINFTVTAPGASSVKVVYRPVDIEAAHIELQTLTQPTDSATGKFTTQFKPPTDFLGEVWAEVNYPDGIQKTTMPISVMARIPEPVATDEQNSKNTTTANSVTQSNNTNNNTSNSTPSTPPVVAPAMPATDSVAPDQVIGGRVEKAAFKPGEPDLRITVNVPSFKLILWQNDKEIATYPISVAMKEFLIPDGERKATEVIWNPSWVPPNSPWVTDTKKAVSPGENIDADDPRNPLGKIKITLGLGYLIHQASKPSDIGKQTSHGCIRMLEPALTDLSEKIVAARSLPVTEQQLQHAKDSTDRLAARLKPPIPVEINYQTQVIENGVLHIYPDIYNRGTNSPDQFRTELQSRGVDVSQLDNQSIEAVIKKLTAKQEYVINIADLQSGNWQTGHYQSLTGEPSAKRSTQKKASKKSVKHGR